MLISWLCTDGGNFEFYNRLLSISWLLIDGGHFEWYNIFLDKCLSADCVRVAASILNSADFSVDPCTDFYKVIILIIFVMYIWFYINLNLWSQKIRYICTFFYLPKSLEIRLFTLCHNFCYTIFCPHYFVTLYSFVYELILIKRKFYC